MAINFPNSPSVNDIHSEGGVRWKWNGSSWTRASGAAVTDTLTTVNDNSTTTLYPVFTSGTGSQTPKVATTATKNISFNASDGNLTVGGNISVGGTITYEDVTNVDSVGIVTARTGIHLDDSITHIGDTNTKIRFPSADTISFETGGSERIRIASSGQIGIAGANYGSSGQVLTSQGSGSAVAWSTIAGLTYFTESANTSSPNNSVAANRFIATGSGSNIDAVFQPKGTGAILAQLPDNATSGGNKRGDYAVDLQTAPRNNANQVASGEGAVIGGGQRNRVSGYPYSTVAGGQDCTITSGGNSFIGGGYLNTIGGTGACILGGTYNTCADSHSTIIGHRAKSRWRGAIIFGANSSTAIGSNGGEQSSITHYKGQTTNATATTIGTTGNTPDTIRSITLPNNSAYGFTMTVIGAVGSGGNTSMWKFEGLIKRGANAASTAIIGNVVKNRIAYDSGASAWDVAVTANTSGSLVVTVTGQASTTIRWIANIETTEITYS